MASEVTTILQLILLSIWTYLEGTPANSQHPLYKTIFTTFDALKGIASTVCLVFANGLLNSLQDATPPTIPFFKTLPSLPTTADKRWAVYLILLEKPGHRPRVYIGSGTESVKGVALRLSQYDRAESLPQYVQRALSEGYAITHKGLLAWTSIPPPALQPTVRLLFLAMEATFAYLFWAMRTPKGGTYGMSQICPWPIDTLTYDGLCSHCCLYERVVGDFDLTAEELEAKAAELKQRRKDLAAVLASNAHKRQMEENWDAYHARKRVKQAAYDQRHPGRTAEFAMAAQATAVETEKYYCETCDLACKSDYDLQAHKKSKKHNRNVAQGDTTSHLEPSTLRALENKPTIASFVTMLLGAIPYLNFTKSQRSTCAKSPKTTSQIRLLCWKARLV